MHLFGIISSLSLLVSSTAVAILAFRTVSDVKNKSLRFVVAELFVAIFHPSKILGQFGLRTRIVEVTGILIFLGTCVIVIMDFPKLLQLGAFTSDTVRISLLDYARSDWKEDQIVYRIEFFPFPLLPSLFLILYIYIFYKTNLDGRLFRFFLLRLQNRFAPRDKTKERAVDGKIAEDEPVVTLNTRKKLLEAAYSKPGIWDEIDKKILEKKGRIMSYEDPKVGHENQALLNMFRKK